MTRSILDLWSNRNPYSGQTTDAAADEPIHDWSSLAKADRIVVELSSGLLSGRVDSISVDGEIFWVYLDHVQGRRLFLHSEVDRLWRLSP